MREVLMGTALLASFLGGVVALLAPCCVSVMLPAYLATGFSRRTGIAAATLVFGAGVATVILPIGLGAHALAAAIVGNHLVVFSTAGVIMILGGVAMLTGWHPRLPMPGRRAPARRGITAAYGLGVFSGAASACCAPVLAGVAVLSGAAGSFPAALAIGLTYVAGMITPLLALALVWDRRDWGSSRLLHGRPLSVRLGRVERRLTLGTLAAGALLIGMGLLTLVAAVTGPAMPNRGWRITLAAQLQHAAATIGRALTFVPGWAVALGLLGFAGIVVAHLRRRPPGAHQVPSTTAASPDSSDSSDSPDASCCAVGSAPDDHAEEVTADDR